MSRWLFCFCIFLAACSSEKREEEGKSHAVGKGAVEELSELPSSLSISTRELSKWDEIIAELTEKFPLERRGDTYRLYGYLYVAQKAFADTSFLIKTTYAGTLDPISFQIIKLFYPNYNNSEMKSDPYSEKLTEVLMEGFTSRFEEEEANLKPVELSGKDDRWQGKPSTNRLIPSLKPWALSHAGEFRAPKPPPPGDSSWKDQLEETKEKASKATDFQKRRSLYWADMIAKKSPDWKIFANEYMEGQDCALEERLTVRARLAVALLDSMIAVYYDKFAYEVKRPFMMDKGLKTYIPTPNHPSYPSAHSTISSAAATVLSYYFPENEKEWLHLVNEASQSRIWAGIHFPVDLEVGEAQGKEIGKAVLFR